MASFPGTKHGNDGLPNGMQADLSFQSSDLLAECRSRPTIVRESSDALNSHGVVGRPDDPGERA